MPAFALARPALFPPADDNNHTWPAPNYVDPEQRGWSAPACLIALVIVTFAIFGARLWARFRITRTPGLDDWLIIASMVRNSVRVRFSELFYHYSNSAPHLTYKQPVLLGQVIATVLGTWVLKPL